MSRSLFTYAATATLTLAIAAVGAGGAAAQDTCRVTTPEDNIAIVTAYIEAHDAADAAAIEAVLHDAFTDDGNRFTLETDDTHNADEVNLAEMIETLYPDSQVRIDEIHAFDNIVVAATTLIVSQHTLTADGTVVTLVAPVEMTGMALYTVECGMIVSARTVTDLHELLTGIGFELAPAM